MAALSVFIKEPTLDWLELVSFLYYKIHKLMLGLGTAVQLIGI
jgi:hypothetical protein